MSFILCGRPLLDSNQAMSKIRLPGRDCLARDPYSPSLPLLTRNERAQARPTKSQINAEIAELELTFESTTSSSRHHPCSLAPPTLPVAVFSVDCDSILGEQSRLRMGTRNYLHYLPYPTYTSICVAAPAECIAPACRAAPARHTAHTARASPALCTTHAEPAEGAALCLPALLCLPCMLGQPRCTLVCRAARAKYIMSACCAMPAASEGPTGCLVPTAHTLSACEDEHATPTRDAVPATHVSAGCAAYSCPAMLAKHAVDVRLFTMYACQQSVACNDVAPATSDAALPCLLYTSPSPRDRTRSRMPSSA